MKLYFAPVPKEFLNDSEYFTDPTSGNSFYYCLDITDEHSGEGMLSIEDTCGRYLPFDFDQLPELINVLSTIQDYREEKEEFIDRWKAIFGV